MLRLIAFALVPSHSSPATPRPAKGGPAPGVLTGWDGAVDAANGVRYVALPAAKTTTVAAVRTSDGRVLRYSTITGAYGIPLVAFDGTTEGISRDGKTLVLASVPNQAETRLAVLSTASLRLKQAITLPGLWAYDALSPNGRILYATQYLGTGAEPALQRPRRQPRHRQAGRRCARRQARAGRADERLPLGARTECERRLGLHVLREAERDRVRPRARHGRPARVLRRSALAVELQRLSAVRLSLSDGGRPLVLSKREWDAWR